MRNLPLLIGVVATVGMLVWGTYIFESWRFNECRKVGHGTAYCVFMLGAR